MSDTRRAVFNIRRDLESIKMYAGLIDRSLNVLMLSATDNPQPSVGGSDACRQPANQSVNITPDGRASIDPNTLFTSTSEMENLRKLSDAAQRQIKMKMNIDWKSKCEVLESQLANQKEINNSLRRSRA